MPHCEICRVLEHASAEENPPEVLTVDQILDRLDGAVCTYTCTVCHSTWMRFKANHLYMGRTPSWQAIG